MYGVREGALRKNICFKKNIHTFSENIYTFKKNIYTFSKTYVFWNVYICGKTYIFRKAPSRTRRVRKGALQKTYVFPHASPEGTQIHVLVSVYLFKDGTR